MNQFKVGCNFEHELITIADELNSEFKNKAEIKEWFGSSPNYAELTARPQWRLPNISDKEFEKFISDARDKGQIFNVVLNSIQPYGGKPEMVAHKKEIQDYVKYLESIGVYRITFANPMMAMFIREVSDIELEASCILHIDAITQMKYLHDTLKVNKLCNNILKNRNKLFLTNLANYCNKNDIILELLAQEFCYNAKKNYAAPCLYRDSCYLAHATCKYKQESMSYNNYPMKYCINSRNGNDASWLKSRWIRPQDLHYYNDLGINYFKLSGRTGGTEYITKIMTAYMSETYSGNLLELWKPLETIYNGEKESSHAFEDYIETEKLDGFLDHWMVNNFECENEECGKTCNYCNNWFNEHLK